MRPRLDWRPLAAALATALVCVIPPLGNPWPYWAPGHCVADTPAVVDN